MSMKFVRGIATGALMGMAIGAAVVPSMNKKTKRKIKRAKRHVMSTAEDIVGTMRNMVEK